MQDLLLGLDLGTTSFKAVACNIRGEELSSSRIVTPWVRSNEGTTMSHHVLAAAVNEVVKLCLLPMDGSRVVSVGVTGMAESGFLVDGSGEVVSPAYSWLDERGAAEAVILNDEFGPAGFSAVTGLPITPRCSLVKLRWINQDRFHRPDGLRWESLPEWVVGHLGGRHQAEFSLSARTGLLDLQTQNWHSELGSWAGLDTNAMISPALAGESWGRIDVAHPYIGGATITVAGHDHVCAALGAGAVRKSDAFDSLGTGEAIIRSMSPMGTDDILRAVQEGLTVGIHVLPEHMLVMAGLGTGVRLSRVLKELKVTLSEDRHRLDEVALKSAPSASAGWAIDAIDRGAYSTPTEVKDAAAVWRTANVAAAARLRRGLKLLETFAGSHNRLIAAGGWFQSDAFSMMRREAFGSPINLPCVKEPTGRGAALLAGVACGLYESSIHAPTPILQEI